MISGNQLSNQIRIDQATTTSQVGSVGLNQGMLIIPQASNLVINLSYGNLPSTVTKEAFEAFEKRLGAATNTIELTRNEIHLLAQALRDLDQRTADIEKLPDGRTKFGSLVSGTPRRVIEAFEAARKFYANGAFADALANATNAIFTMEQGEQTATDLVKAGEIKSEFKAILFSLASECAQQLGAHALAHEFAHKSVNANPTARNQALLATTFFNIGRESLTRGDLLSASDKFTNAINALIESQKGSNPQVGLLPTNDVAMMFSFAAETSQKLGDEIQAYEFSKRAFEADSSGFHQAQMASSLLNLGRRDEAKVAIEVAFRKNPNDPQIAGLWKRITGAP
ncbi:MAG: tetratricopeptide repeat protein [Pirellulaceae bacterium]